MRYWQKHVDDINILNFSSGTKRTDIVEKNSLQMREMVTVMYAALAGSVASKRKPEKIQA